ncbi:tRNA lysidine(34) synthetase TilS [Pseudomonas sp. CDFA 553]|uniref:tRNA lysidine(34) synthetase TilS n=1 Tax=Pseudomonas quasicaspiana TaxID=2829821 RepID=UPI001E32AA57|nr:tRNA lysidine(34) synthetase TilS [Pseudomonas quasicaspiana]MCD5988120.1 tRNA lysidine(34) synthetase TilS [Pseudomonas quasicaspiana]
MTTSKPSGHDLPARLLQVLAPWRSAPAWYVGFSGGLDSTVLLHLLVELAKRENLPPLNAIHVHHGLQAVADAWPLHCQQVCDALGVPLRVISVQVKPGASIEQAARDARYAAFSDLLAEDEVLLTGQHQDDQAETLLFRLLRGAGVRGLAGMPVSRTLGQGHLLRPLLSFSREELEAYASKHRLLWVEDPSNEDSHYSRNYLRSQVLPVVKSRWPQATASMARTAAHLDEAQQLLEELAQADLESAQSLHAFGWLKVPSLALPELANLSPARQRNALRHWLVPLTRLPDSDHWVGWENLRDAGPGGRPVWRLADGELHRDQGRIWWLSDSWLQPLMQPAQYWMDARHALELPGNGQVFIDGETPSGLLEVRYRQGGEVLSLPGRGRRDLKRLLNEREIPLFVRGRLPLLFRNGEILAVANLPALNVCGHESGVLHWVPPTNDQSLS